ncbi:MAG TPA: glycosyltransferase family 39 protein [Acidimicrobiia bacterium]|nr:glycosyltransferase family 39 protein [Acidimicrobiia bacterium]
MTVPAIPATPSTPTDVEADVSTVEAPAAEGRSGRSIPWAALAIGIVVAAGVVARFVAASHLWLDEALTVNIARLPLSQLPEALRHDGSPPLYYAVLHGWMQLFGSGTIAVRALSGMCSVACLPLAWRVGKRVGGRTVATSFLVLLALSPFAAQYATEARMYAMAMLLVLAGGLALANLLERPSLGLCAAVALLTGALLLTHYYALYTVAAVGAVLAWHAWRGEERAATRRALLSMVAGSLLFVPWLGVLLYQTAHTGAPWGSTGRGVRTVIDSLGVLVSGYRDAGPVPLLLALGLIALAVFGRAVGRRRFEIDLVGREPGRTLAVLTFGGLLLAVAVSDLTGQAYVPRYASIVFPGVLLLVAVGVASFGDARLRLAALVVMAGIGVLGIQPVMAYERTQAASVARHLRAEAQPGDVVAYCPDQLGPSVSRLLPADNGITQLSYPRATAPEFVNWVDYRNTIRSTDVLPFAQMLLERAGPAHNVWLVWSTGYKSFGRRCEELLHTLGGYRNWGDHVRINPLRPEKMGLIRFAPGELYEGPFSQRCYRPPGC